MSRADRTRLTALDREARASFSEALAERVWAGTFSGDRS